MANKQEVENFLKQLHDKMLVYDIAFRPRDKNLKAIADLDLIPLERIDIIRKLNPEDYYSGPNKNTHEPTKPDYFEFGVNVNGKEVYIKISLGSPNKMIDCMSFHVAEFSMNYPLK